MNAADRAVAELAERLDSLAREQAMADFLWLMNAPQGRRFMWALLGECAVFSTSFNTHDGLMVLAEGRKQIGYQFLQQINQHCPELYVLMMQEANEAARNRQRQLDATGDPDGSSD